MKKSMIAFVFGLGVVFNLAQARASEIRETFEAGTVGTTNLPVNWTLIDVGGDAPEPDAVYTNVAGSDGAGGGAGVGGEVIAPDLLASPPYWYAPGAYIVHSANFDSSEAVVGAFDVLIRPDAQTNRVVMLFGDIGGGMTLNANDALLQWIYESTDGDLYLVDGSAVIAGRFERRNGAKIDEGTWYRMHFSWTPTGVATGNFSARMFEAATGEPIGVKAFTANGFGLHPSSVQCGFGTRNRNGVVDNIDVRAVPEVFSEDFEGLAVGTTNLPSGWVMFDTGGAPPEPDAVYTNVVGSDGQGGDSGVAGEVTSSDYGYTNLLPGAYIVAPTPLTPAQPFSGSFDVLFTGSTYWNSGSFVLGDIAEGLTTNANDALSLALRSSWNRDPRTTLADGAGGILEYVSLNLSPSTWYQVDFFWTVRDGKTGDFSANIIDKATDKLLCTLSTGRFTFDPDWLYFGFGSMNHSLKFDNIKLRGTPPPRGSVIILQ